MVYYWYECASYLYVQQSSADEVVVRVSQVVKQKKEGSDCRHPD